MLHTTGSFRKTFLIFIVGVTLGFVATYIVFAASDPEGEDLIVKQQGVPGTSRSFVPNAPHSFGEANQFSGPDQAQVWHDGHDDSDEHGEAGELKAKVRVLCWVLTSPATMKSKASHVKATWGRRCNKLLFMSSEDDPDFPTVGLPVNEGRDFLWGKTREAFRYVYTNHYNDADWFLKADDDTYVIIENLRYMLSGLNPQEPVYLGRRFKPYIPQGYMSGGAGYVLSKGALKKFVTEALTNPAICRSDPGGPEDLEMGQCMQNIGVKAGDSRDNIGRETFNPFVPEHHLVPGLVPRDNWFWTYTYYTAKEGPECCSDHAISFHYVPPNMMYVFEYMVYHLKPHGKSTHIVLPPGHSAHKYLPHNPTHQEVHIPHEPSTTLYPPNPVLGSTVKFGESPIEGSNVGYNSYTGPRKYQMSDMLDRIKRDEALRMQQANDRESGKLNKSKLSASEERKLANKYAAQYKKRVSDLGDTPDTVQQSVNKKTDEMPKRRRLSASEELALAKKRVEMNLMKLSNKANQESQGTAHSKHDAQHDQRHPDQDSVYKHFEEQTHDVKKKHQEASEPKKAYNQAKHRQLLDTGLV